MDVYEMYLVAKHENEEKARIDKENRERRLRTTNTPYEVFASDLIFDYRERITNSAKSGSTSTWIMLSKPEVRARPEGPAQENVVVVIPGFGRFRVAEMTDVDGRINVGVTCIPNEAQPKPPKPTTIADCPPGEYRIQLPSLKGRDC
jgi:hypothetical protein